MNVLFVCTANYQRSRTAEDLFRLLRPEHAYLSAGVSAKECVRRGTTLCTVELLAWADQVIVFEQLHLERIQTHTGDRFTSKITLCPIPDVYQYMQPELVDLLKSQIPFTD